MTDREKAIVMAYTGRTMLAGDKLGIYYKYVQEKLGRSVMTHELAYQEVQDAIEEAAKKDFIAIAKADNGWISVKDRLPETKENPLTMDFQEVICFCDFGGRPKRTDVRTYGFGQRSWEKEPHFWHGPQIMDGVVTNWMPLPEPPKEVKQNE